MTVPPLLVLLPVYNAGPYLDGAIRSIRDQTFGDFEFVIVNDGSTDGSPKVIRRHAAEDPRIVVIDQPNAGLVAALNRGVAACRAEVVARMDGDDLAHPRRFEVSMRTFASRPELGVLGTQAISIDSSGKTRGPVDLPLEHDDIDRFAIDTGWCGLLHPTLLVRTELLRRFPYDARYPSAEDYDLMLRLAEVTRLANLAEPLLDYRYHAGSVSGSRQAEQADSVYRALRAASRRRGRPYRDPLARHAYRASWLARDRGRHALAVARAIDSWWSQPLHSWGPRALVSACLASAGLYRTASQREAQP